MLLCDLACENNKIKKEFRVARLHSATNGPDTSWSDDWMVLLAVYPDMAVQSPPAPNKAGDMAPFIPFQNYKDFIVVKTMFWFWGYVLKALICHSWQKKILNCKKIKSKNIECHQ